MRKCTNPNCEQENPQPLSNFGFRKTKKGTVIRKSRCNKCLSHYVSKVYMQRPGKKEIKTKYREKTRDRTNRLQNERYKTKGRDYQFKNKYGITLETYNQMLIDQNKKCKLCGKEERIKGRELAVDHCHLTGKVRGLLCFDCNTALGKFKDDIVLLQRAIDYLLKEGLSASNYH